MLSADPCWMPLLHICRAMLMTDTKACVAVFSWDQLWVYPLLRELLYAGVYAEIRSVCALDLLVCARDLLVCAREVCISGYTCVCVCLSVCLCVCVACITYHAYLDMCTHVRMS